MQQTEVAAGDNAPPPAIMIELAPEPEAAMPEETQIAEQTEDSEEIKSDTPDPVEPQPEAPPEEVTPPEPPPPEPIVEEQPPEPEPVQEVTETVPEEPPEPQVDPIVEEQMAALDNVEVPLPTMRPPEPVEKKPEEPVKKKVAEKPRPKKQVQASQARQEAKVDANQSDRTAAQQTSASNSRSSSMSPQRWQGRLAAHLERRKRYPAAARSKREEGTVYVRFQIDNSGNVLSVSLSRSSGSSALDQEVLALVKRASPVPAPPTGVNKTITFPMQFTIR
ncbi:TonB family protein [Rhizobiales bacterium RZME27]|uniref:Protein TonB n=2 Tax=Endobacterium cereale TaxID=2663029 RepID=A0A6A8A1V8_9HYPH|nr:TonB family protein [Endobacterium cereale]MQY44965.1 TonB family protein [Endobacterium cereale]